MCICLVAAPHTTKRCNIKRSLHEQREHTTLQKRRLEQNHHQPQEPRIVSISSQTLRYQEISLYTRGIFMQYRQKIVIVRDLPAFHKLPPSGRRETLRTVPSPLRSGSLIGCKQTNSFLSICD